MQIISHYFTYITFSNYYIFKLLHYHTNTTIASVTLVHYHSYLIYDDTDEDIMSMIKDIAVH